jgi:hypothetical protein
MSQTGRQYTWLTISKFLLLSSSLVSPSSIPCGSTKQKPQLGLYLYTHPSSALLDFSVLLTDHAESMTEYFNVLLNLTKREMHLEFYAKIKNCAFCLLPNYIMLEQLTGKLTIMTSQVLKGIMF